MFTDDQRQRKWTFPLDLLHWTFWQVKGNSHNQGSLTAPCFHPRIKQDLLPVGRNRTTPPNWSLSRLRSKKQKSTICAAPCVECLLTVLYLQRHRGISNIHHFSFFFSVNCELNWEHLPHRTCQQCTCFVRSICSSCLPPRYQVRAATLPRWLFKVKVWHVAYNKRGLIKCLIIIVSLFL